MLTLDYQLDPAATQKAKEVDMASANAVALRYRLFPGDIVIRANDVDFSTHWGWVQVLDFALSIEVIGQSLGREKQARFEFTESDAALEFRRMDGVVSISSSYAPGQIQLPLIEFQGQAKRFARRVTQELCEQHPRLRLNPELKSDRS